MIRPADKLKSLGGRLSRRLKTAKIRFSAGYDGVHAPSLNHAFVEALWGEGSPFCELLARNAHAEEDGERLLRREFRVFGREIRGDAQDFSWYKDFFSGFVYSRVPYPDIRIVADEGHDIIVPWELSRLQFVPTMIQAHRVTGNEEYAFLFQAIVDDWIEENPFLVGVNWYTGMEVAIRAINLGLGVVYFRDYLAERFGRYTQVLWAHAEAVFARVFRRVRSHRNNHFLVACVGLLALGLCFRGRQAERFVGIALEHLGREILRQFRPDGGNFESAVHYHQLSLETVLVGACLLAVGRIAGSHGLGGCDLSAEVQERVAKAVTFVSDYMIAFGRSPQFGDSDDGRIFIFEDYFTWDQLDHRFVDEIGRVAFPDQVQRFDRIVNQIYPDSGYGFFANDAYGVCLNASPVAEATHGGHNHCDKGSLILRVGGAPVFVDSGTYCYTPDIQARFAHKRTRAHNVVMVDGRDQAGVDARRTFGRPEGIEPVIRCERQGDVPAWIMTHNGYCRYEGLGATTRIVRCGARTVDIEEQIEGQGEHTVDIIFNLHPRVCYEIEDDVVVCVRDGKVLCRLEVPAGFGVHAERGFYSPAYTKREEHDVIVLSCRSRLPLVVHYAVHVCSSQEGPDG